MAHVEILGAGEVGIVTDVPAHELPANAWTSGKNVRAWNGKIQKFMGHTAVFDPPSAPPYWLMPVPTDSAYLWLYPGDAGSAHKVYATDMAAHYNITRQSAGVDVNYSSTAVNDWSGGIIGGVPVINNGFDEPQMWLPPGAAQRLANLSNWPANTKAATLRVFKEYLVALDVIKTATRYPQLVKWSHTAQPGAVPSSWDETDATKDAGEQPLSGTKGACIDCFTLRDSNIIYKDDSVWAMQYIGRPRFPFAFRKLFGEFGILARNCAKEFSSGKHVVATREDIDLIVHDGVNWQSVLDGRRRAALRAAMSYQYFERSYMVLLRHRNEVWFCYPSTDSTGYADRALIWNFKQNTFLDRDIPLAAFIETGIIDPQTSQAWNSDSQAWDLDTSVWDDRLYNPTQSSPLFAVPGVTKLYRGDSTEQFAGVNMDSYIERIGLSVVAQGRDGNPASERDSVKFISEIWPKFSRIAGTGSIEIYVGSQMRIDDAVTWSGPFAFNPATDRKIDCAVTGVFWGVRLRSTENMAWELSGYGVEVVRDGLY